MKYQLAALAALAGLASASPILKREVPQEHSHELYLIIVREFLALDNPKGIVDPIFGFLGNAAAAEGAGDVTNLDCLKQETADQAFTNAKAIEDTRGMAAALVFQALERNTGSVGLRSAECTDIAVNPEIAALVQHQDPAAEGAAEENKAITLELARQLALIGADPLLSLESGTFEPGEIGDPTAAGNSCNTQPDDIGCIFSEGRLVLDASPDEIAAAVEDIEPTFTGTGELLPTNIDFDELPVAEVDDDNLPQIGVVVDAEPTAEPNADDLVCVLVAGQTCTIITTTVAATATEDMLATVTGGADVVATPAGLNVQVFTGTLGGPPPPVVSSAGDRPFEVNGATFTGQGAALSRSCDIQKNACANEANAAGLGIAACEEQVADCKAANALKLKARKVAAAKAHLRARKMAITKRQSGLDLGSCSDPTIQFGEGFDGRREASFAPLNNDDFNHGSAQRIGIISSFICQRLQDSCKAPAETVQICDEASEVAQATSQDQAAADIFNSALGGAAVAADGDEDVEEPTAVEDDEDSTLTEELVVMTITQCPEA